MEVIRPGSLKLNNSFIDPTATVDSPVIMEGGYIYIAPFVEFHSSKTDIRVGERTNIQDCAKIHGPSFIGSNVTIGHRAEIHNSTINDFAFIGFNAKVINSRVGRGAFVSHGAVIQGMNIEQDYYVPPGGREAQDKVDKEKKRFRDEVLEVNTQLVLGYMKLYSEKGADAFSLVGPAPKTGWVKINLYPDADKARRIGIARIIGGVVFKGRAELEDGVSIRGDEGYPITFGEGVTIGRGSVFHSQKGSTIEVGNNVRIGASCVIHGPVVIGDGAVIEDGSILLGCEVAKGQRIPPGSIFVPGK